jgi:clan AA aspartic protease
MGLVYAHIDLSNPIQVNKQLLQVKCLVDTGSTYLCIPSHIAAQLGLQPLETRVATLTNGESQTVPYVGPIRVTFANRNCFVGALVLGDEILLGTLPMEDMDLIVQPKLLKLSVNPDSPNIARGQAK